MRSFWQRWRDPLGLHTRLEARRSRPRPEFVHQLADELNGTRRRARPALRLALAGALTLMMLVAAGTLGGTSYAASAAGSVANAVTGIAGGSGKAVAARNADDDDDDGGDDDDDDDDPDDDQYEEEREECERAVKEARQDFRATQSASHGLFHQQNAGRSAHRAFHRQLEDADRAQRRLMRAALEECDDIGGGGGGDDDDDDEEDDD